MFLTAFTTFFALIVLGYVLVAAGKTTIERLPVDVGFFLLFSAFAPVTHNFITSLGVN